MSFNSPTPHPAVRWCRMNSPLLSLPGAVAAEGPDEGVAAHYGDLFREQRALADGHRLRRPLAPRRRHRLRRGPAHLAASAAHPARQRAPAGPRHRGADPLRATGTSSTPCTSSTTATTVWMHTEPGTQGALIAYLESMRFFYRVEIADRTEEFAVVHLPGGLHRRGARRRRRTGDRARPRSVPAARRAGVLRRRARPGRRGARLRGAARRGAPAAARAWRPTTAPSRTSWAGSARPCTCEKGCYRGQETVARVHNLGKPPRRLVFLHLDGSEVRLPGARRPGAARRGRAGGPPARASSPPPPATTSSGPIALALVKRNVPVDAALIAGEDATAAAQEVVVAP